jgi:formylglycine-generating enzyme required for sulfatase activity
MLGDVLAHLVGEELNRSKNYDVVTRSNAVQNKLEALRRGYDKLDGYLLRTWADGEGINTLCVVTTTSGFNFSLKLLDVSSGEVLCNVSRVEPNAVALKQLAWSLTGSMGSSCTPFGFLDNQTESLIGMEMVYVEGGKFEMGCKSGRDDLNGHTCDGNEQPLHDVTVGSFWIGKHEVTHLQWQALMETTHEYQRYLYDTEASSVYGAGVNYPMYYVNWDEAVAFCDTLSARTGKTYRLPTEEEWEYAARGGKLSRGYVYSGSNSIDSVAWYSGNSGTNGGSSNIKTHIVGTTKKAGNELGICDMSGNLKEWCYSNWRSDYSALENTSYRVIRGGSFYESASYCRIASRSAPSYHVNNPSSRSPNVGFRVV